MEINKDTPLIEKDYERCKELAFKRNLLFLGFVEGHITHLTPT